MSQEIKIVNFQGKWIEFVEVTTNKDKKTKQFNVINRESRIFLGTVKWFGNWRQYSFFPQPNMVFERQCLMDIAHFINQLMVERKVVRQQIHNIK